MLNYWVDCGPSVIMEYYVISHPKTLQEHKGQKDICMSEKICSEAQEPETMAASQENWRPGDKEADITFRYLPCIYIIIQNSTFEY